MICLDDETVLGLVEGRLPPPRLSAVDDHLDGCATCRDVVSQLARAGAPAGVLDRGSQLGRYVVGDLLGAGAMGRVYSAWEPELDRRVAIKVLQDDAPGARARLVREAQAMARLDHPNVVGVHEVGTTAAGVFVAMDLVEGHTLRAWAEASPRPWREVARLLADTARGLAAIHAAGVIHRDVKPDNIIVGDDGRARIGDFGLARSGRSAHEPATGRPGPEPAAAGDPGVLALGTPATAIAGTPAYMAPEVLRGGAATEASDQFGFGVTAYELIAGKRPFSGQTWSELLGAIEAGAASPLRGVPGWLDAAIRRCLAGSPQRRFPSMSSLAAHLADRSQRRRTAWIAAAAAAVLASGATWYAVRGAPAAAATTCEAGAAQIGQLWNPTARGRLAGLGEPGLRALDAWAAQWAAERDATCAASKLEPAARLAAREHCLDRRRGELGALIDRAAQPTARPERLLDALADLSPSECRTVAPNAPDPLPLDPDRAALARAVQADLAGVRAAISLGDVRPIAAPAAALVDRARASGHGPTLAEALLAHADALRGTADLATAAAAARDAVVAADRGHDDLAAARAWIARVAIAGDRRDLASADDFGAVAAGAVDRAGAPPRLSGQLLRLRGLVAFNRGRLDESRALLDESRARFAAASGERSVDVAGVESALGIVARERGDLTAAERHQRAALATSRELRGPRHPDVARDLHNLAGVLRRRKALDAAAASYREALAILVATRGETSADAGLTHNSLGLVHMERRDWPAARAALSLARTALTAAGHGDAVFAEHNLGLVAAATADHRAALAHFALAATLYAATLGADARPALQLLVDRARSEASLGDLAAARDHATSARTGALAANLQYLVAEATELLASPALAPPAALAPPSSPAPPIRVVVEPPPPPSAPLREPTRTPDPPLPRPPLAPTAPQPTRDVGTYGASQGF